MDLAQDLRFGVRILLRHPTVTIISVITLALGIGATTAVFSLVNATLLTPLPFDEPHELVMIFSAKPSAGYTTQTISLPDFRDWAAEDSIVEDAGIFTMVPVNVMGTEHPDRLVAMRASAGVLRSLGVSPSLGRSYDSSSDDPAASPVVLLSDASWRNRYGADPGIVGTTMSIDGVAHEVIGVLPREGRGRHPNFRHLDAVHFRGGAVRGALTAQLRLDRQIARRGNAGSGGSGR